MDKWYFSQRNGQIAFPLQKSKLLDINTEEGREGKEVVAGKIPVIHNDWQLGTAKPPVHTWVQC